MPTVQRRTLPSTSAMPSERARHDPPMAFEQARAAAGCAMSAARPCCARGEQAVGWALHALEPDEDIDIEFHLLKCPGCRAAVGDAEAVMARLAKAIEHSIRPYRYAPRSSRRPPRRSLDGRPAGVDVDASTRPALSFPAADLAEPAGADHDVRETADRRRWSYRSRVIHDVTELREHGRVCRGGHPSTVSMPSTSGYAAPSAGGCASRVCAGASLVPQVVPRRRRCMAGHATPCGAAATPDPRLTIAGPTSAGVQATSLLFSALHWLHRLPRPSCLQNRAIDS
jgi:hypothetical protein